MFPSSFSFFVYENPLFSGLGATLPLRPRGPTSRGKRQISAFPERSSALQSAFTDGRRIEATTAITDRSPVSAFVDALRALTAGAKLVAAIVKTYSVSLGARSNCPDRGLREGG